MIARMWHGMTPADRAEAYLAFLVARALPDYRATPGNMAAHVLHRIEGGVAHFVTLSFWESREAIEGFAGTDITLAKYYPEDTGFLLEFEATVQHFEVTS